MLIKEHILPKLKRARETEFKPNTIATFNCLTGPDGYDVHELEFEDASFKTADFIFKFIRINQKDFESLFLKHIYTDDHLLNLSQFFKEKYVKLKELYLENCALSLPHL